MGCGSDDVERVSPCEGDDIEGLVAVLEAFDDLSRGREP